MVDGRGQIGGRRWVAGGIGRIAITEARDHTALDAAASQDRTTQSLTSLYHTAADLTRSEADFQSTLAMLDTLAKPALLQLAEAIGFVGAAQLSAPSCRRRCERRSPTGGRPPRGVCCWVARIHPQEICHERPQGVLPPALG